MKQCCAIAGPRLGFNLRTLLIEPVQRIPRYQMLIKTMLDYTQKNSPDYAPLKRALTNISNTANMINENVAKYAELTILQRLGTMLFVNTEPARMRAYHHGIWLQAIASSRRKFCASAPIGALLLTSTLLSARSMASSILFNFPVTMRSLKAWQRGYTVLQLIIDVLSFLHLLFLLGRDIKTFGGNTL